VNTLTSFIFQPDLFDGVLEKELFPPLVDTARLLKPDSHDPCNRTGCNLYVIALSITYIIAPTVPIIGLSASTVYPTGPPRPISDASPDLRRVSLAL